MLTPERIEKFLENLDEATTYLVEVQLFENNPKHRAVLFVNYLNGKDCTIYAHTYKKPVPLREVYSITMFTKLAKLKK